MRVPAGDLWLQVPTASRSRSELLDTSQTHSAPPGLRRLDQGLGARPADPGTVTQSNQILVARGSTVAGDGAVRSPQVLNRAPRPV